MLKILVVEGNSEDILKSLQSSGLQPASEHYRNALLYHAGDSNIDIAIPDAPHTENILRDLSAYDGFALTGSGVAWSSSDEEAKPYLEYIAKIFEQGKPVIGSCWGMQTVAQLYGGHSEPNHMGTELGLAEGLSLNPAGIEHFVFAGMPKQFSSPCIHRDHVTKMPEGFEILASNSVSSVQAMASTRADIDFVGFQYHPEYTLEYVANIVKSRGGTPMNGEQISSFPNSLPETVANNDVRTRVFKNWTKHVSDQKARRATIAA